MVRLALAPSPLAPSAPATQHELGRDGLMAITAVRSELIDLAIDCLNQTKEMHEYEIALATAWLDRALRTVTAPGARAAIQRVRADLAALRPRARAVSLDDLGTAYGVAEMRLAAILLADHDEREAI